ncbi:MAG TPA: GNAT family N-acetyltransferase [Candidatus Limnocylindrales bacterium]
MTGPAVRLRPVEDADLPTFLAQEHDPATAAMAVMTPRAPDDFYAHWATIRAVPTNVLRSITVDDVLVGRIMTWLQDGEREVGYVIGRDVWGRGYATEALRLLLEEVAERPVVAHVARENIGSRRVLEHCGFTVVAERIAEDGVQELTLRLD